jgi:kynureninase
MVLLEVPEAERLAAHLKRHDIYTDSRRNEVVRMAPFVWNSVAEIDQTFEMIETALSTGAYRSVEVDAAGPVT